MIWTYLQRGQLSCTYDVTAWFLWTVADCWLTQELVEGLRLLNKDWGSSLRQHLLAEAQLGRQAGDVADGEAQRLDLGQGLSCRRHWWWEVGPEVMQSLGQVPHPQLLPLAGCLALLPWIPGARFLWSGSCCGGFGAGQSLCLGGKMRCCGAVENETLQSILFISSSLEGGGWETEGVHRGCGRQAAACAEIPGVRSWITGHRITRFLQ